MKTVFLAFAGAGCMRQAEALANTLGLKTLGTGNSYVQLVNTLQSLAPDIVFADILLPGLPVSGVDRTLSLNKRPAVLYFAPKTATSLMKTGYAPVVSLSDDANVIRLALDSIYPVPAFPEDVKAARGILTSMGFTNIRGTEYLAHASALVVNDRESARQLKAKIYPQLVKAFDTTPSRAQDSMRRAIDRAFLTGDIEKQYSFFLNTIDETRGKPTVSALIALIAEMIRLKETNT